MAGGGDWFCDGEGQGDIWVIQVDSAKKEVSSVGIFEK